MPFKPAPSPTSSEVTAAVLAVVPAHEIVPPRGRTVKVQVGMDCTYAAFYTESGLLVRCFEFADGKFKTVKVARWNGAAKSYFDIPTPDHLKALLA